MAHLFFIFAALTFRRTHLFKLKRQLSSVKLSGALFVRSLASATGWTAYFYALSLGFVYQITGLGQLRPVIVVILAALLLKEKESKRRFIGTFIIIIGALLIVLSS